MAGLAMALFGTLDEAREDPAAIGAVALVDGVAISHERFDAAVAAGPPGASRTAVLDDLIAEELLVAWALELDLPRLAAIPRAQLLREVTAIATAEADEEEPTEAELRAFYDAHPEHFRGHQLVAVEALWFRGAEPERAREAQAAWAGGAATGAVQAMADSAAARLPTGLVPMATWRDYLGPSAVRALEDLSPGEVSPVLRAAGGHRVLRLVERRVVERPAFEAVREAVRSRLRVERRAERLRAAVAARRSAAEVVVHEPALVEPDAR